MTGTLAGISVLVTRPAGQADSLCALLEEQGASAMRMPLLAIKKIDGTAKIKASEKFQAYDWVIFVSANAVNFALQTNSGKISAQTFADVRFAAIGNATADAMRLWRLPVAYCPESGFNSETLLASPEFQQVKDLKILLVRGQGGRELLADTLRQRGARVSYWEVYKRVKPPLTQRTLLEKIEHTSLLAVTLTSGEALQNFIELCGETLLQRCLALPLVVVSERIKRMAEQAGFTTIAVAADASDAAIINALSVLMGGENRGRID